MEMERVTEFPLTHLDRRPRKRPRLCWDVAPETPMVSHLFFCFSNCCFCILSTRSGLGLLYISLFFIRVLIILINYLDLLIN